MKVEASIQKWGNGLALRVSGVIRDIPHFEEGMQVIVDVNEEGFTVKKIDQAPKREKKFTEKDLLKGMTAYTAHADEVAEIDDKEWGA